MRRESLVHLPFTKLWILYSVFCSATGWILSAFHALNGMWWAVSAIFFIFALSRLPGLQPLAPVHRLHSRFLHALWFRRFRRPLPLCFLLAAIVVSLRCFANPGLYEGGDVYSYRLPRVLHWIHDQGWTWIPCFDVRLNNRGCGFEWMELPFLLFGHSDRMIPLLTAIPFFLLPGLIFVTFRSLKISARVAWSWCWLLPSASCILFQAGTGSTDGMGVVYALAAVGLALEARRRSDASYVYYAILSAALLINLKASNVPLLLPIGLAIWFSRALLLQRPMVTSGVLLLAALASFLPIAIANTIHLHDWTGMAGETMIYKPANPAIAFLFNTVLVFAYFVAPPLLPISEHVPNIFQSLHGTFLWPILNTQFEQNYGMIRRRRDEDLSGLGLGIALLLAPFIWSFLTSGFKGRTKAKPAFRLVDASAWIALFVTMGKSTLFALPRVLATYYPFLLVPFLRVGTAADIVRARWWRWLGVAQFGVALGMVLISSSSPPWPLQAVLWMEPYLANTTLHRYIVSTYSGSEKYLEFQKSIAYQLPPDKEIGLFRRWDQAESVLWQPYGSRLITQIRPEDTRESLLRRGIRYIIVAPRSDPAAMIDRFGATVEKKYTYVEPIFSETMNIYLLRINSP